ncbi:MAG TPA: C1 family peptidase [Thermoanaerobaculia bacterium]|jgi:C1A family cysteine protease|nr:C1 family peptidase [Thermoanaerobaculia bacterium]
MFSRHATLPETEKVVGTGWLPPVPDLRDYHEGKPEIAEMAKKLGLTAKKNGALAAPSTVDLRPWCSPIEDQKNLGSCTAQAGVGVVEYFERRSFDKHLDGSRLFVYKATRNLMQVTGDTGAWLRNTMGALVLCGVPDEKYWPYTDATPDFDKEPPSFLYAVADNCEALKYFAHDPIGANVAGAAVLASVKKYLAAGIPSMFGFWGFPSFGSSDVKGGIPYPCSGEQVQWGHAVVAVGYDDAKKIKNTQCNKTTTGALLIRNSWGTGWGDKGYGWLPYDYVLNKLALDFWSLLCMEWVDTKNFGI